MMEDLQNVAAVQDWNEEYFAKTGSFKFLKPDDLVAAPEYLEVAYAGMGWMLIKKDVVESIKYPWFWSGLQTVGRTEGPSLVDMNSEDVAFCKALKAAGHPVYLDTKLRVGHQKMLII
jgi:hypothetical protein